MGHNCVACDIKPAALRRPKTKQQVCKECFFTAFEDEIHQTIIKNKLFKSGERVAVAASGGKDSTVLAHLMSLLNKRHGYGLDLFLLSIDEGIEGYRDDSLETVKRNEKQYGMPLTVLSYKSLYGWTMDEIVRKIGKKNNCTFCGVFRRQALDRGAHMMGADKMVTGHNADDMAETTLLNLLRGDVARLSRCAAIVTGEDSALPRCKPFKYTFEKEIVMYAYFKKLDYFSTECIYSPDAYRGFARDFVKDLENIRPEAILDIIRSAENFQFETTTKMPKQGTCEQCGYITSQKWCKACVLLEGLNQGQPLLGIGKARKGGNVGNRSAHSGDQNCESEGHGRAQKGGNDGDPSAAEGRGIGILGIGSARKGSNDADPSAHSGDPSAHSGQCQVSEARGTEEAQKGHGKGRRNRRTRQGARVAEKSVQISYEQTS